MKEDWVKIFSSSELYKSKIAEDILKQNGIESHIESKRDSAFPSLGSADLYTLPDIAQTAIQVLEANDLR